MFRPRAQRRRGWFWLRKASSWRRPPNLCRCAVPGVFEASRADEAASRRQISPSLPSSFKAGAGGQERKSLAMSNLRPEEILDPWTLPVSLKATRGLRPAYVHACALACTCLHPLTLLSWSASTLRLLLLSSSFTRSRSELGFTRGWESACCTLESSRGRSLDSGRLQLEASERLHAGSVFREHTHTHTRFFE